MLERDFLSKKFGKNAATLERNGTSEGDDPREGASPPQSNRMEQGVQCRDASVMAQGSNPLPREIVL